MVLFLGVTALSAQDVRYYKLVRKKTATENITNVSGGQFITFAADVCFESNNRGTAVGHGALTRNDNYSNLQYSIYQGNSYWGKNTSFKFNSDKSIMNVVLDNGDIYVYKQATPPAGVTTCSLIRKADNPSGGYDPVEVYPTQPYTSVVDPYAQPQPQPDPEPQPKPEPKQPKPCSYCNGTGEVIKPYDGFSTTVDPRKYCDKCGTTEPQHSHVPCPVCLGKKYQ